ncbi:hypothetical protein MGYG_05156 [Nannizzia gypsea CBS 118893]|uniref:Uncharacterized protein n=1 Tax=Arthroderma gypseum (strain ATCC MYA-4604 / CBS 118893) TaxID=535722 RepID=E4UYJ0_ARTGP|nr:hypothetical protein MGYG_05156 [Nannizzia gypsea CBS 118893]EFR02153.1 hypothetical protein MGYG_05156 [Nannizzia gypsea CBS 118893]
MAIAPLEGGQEPGSQAHRLTDRARKKGTLQTGMRWPTNENAELGQFWECSAWVKTSWRREGTLLVGYYRARRGTGTRDDGHGHGWIGAWIRRLFTVFTVCPGLGETDRKLTPLRHAGTDGHKNEKSGRGREETGGKMCYRQGGRQEHHLGLYRGKVR